MSLSDQLRPVRRWLLPAIGVCCLVVLAGCGGSEEPVASDAESKADSSPAATPETPVSDAVPVPVVDAAATHTGKHDADEDDAPPPVATAASAPPAAPPFQIKLRSGDVDVPGIRSLPVDRRWGSGRVGHDSTL